MVPLDYPDPSDRPRGPNYIKRDKERTIRSYEKMIKSTNDTPWYLNDIAQGIVDYTKILEECDDESEVEAFFLHVQNYEMLLTAIERCEGSSPRLEEVYQKLSNFNEAIKTKLGSMMDKNDMKGTKLHPSYLVDI